MTAKRILVPLDGSESAEVAATLAADLARGSGGGVRLLQERLSAEGRDYLESVEAQLGPVPAETVVRFGEPAQEILVEAEAFDADMIVVTAARRGWLDRFTGGGLGEKLLHASPVPVVLVRAT